MPIRLSAAQIRQLYAKLPPGQEPPPASTKPSKLELNKNEQALLQHLLSLPDVIDIWPHGIRIVLGENCRYEPDFLVQFKDGRLELWEAKALWSNGQRGMDDSRVKVKATATQFPFPVVIATKQPKKKGGGWIIERFESVRRYIQATSDTPAGKTD